MGGRSVDAGPLAELAKRASAAREAAKRPHATDAGASVVPEIQDLLAGAVQLLARATGAARIAAWAQRLDGTPFVAASAFRGDPPRAADASALEAIWGLGGATDLGLPGVPPALAVLVDQHGFGAAAPLFSRPGEPLAVLLLGGDDDLAGHVRPRTLADLDAAVRRLTAPATTAASVQRLARLDSDVQRLDRLAALGDLLSETVHELRNPLVSFKTFVELAPEHATDPEFQNGFRSLVADEIGRMERLLDNLMRHARPSASLDASRAAGPAEVAAALESLGQLLQQRARQRQVSLSVSHDAELPSVALAPDALRQILLNLALNALDASPSGGAVTLSASRVGASVEFCIEDQGPGVAHDQRDQIFEPFFSTRADRPGGLGLAISRKLVDEAGGWIKVGDAPGGGARFRVSLPAELADSTKSATRTAPADPSPKTR